MKLKWQTRLAGTCALMSVLLAHPANAYVNLIPTAATRCEVAGAALNTVFVSVGAAFSGAANGTTMTYKFTNTSTGSVLTFTRNTVPQDTFGFPIPAGTWRIDVSSPGVGGRPVTLVVPQFERRGRVCMEVKIIEHKTGSGSKSQ